MNDIHGRIFSLITGLTNKRIKRLEDALDCFYKLHAILRNSPQVIYQIADMYPFLQHIVICRNKQIYEHKTEYFLIHQF